VTAGEAGSTAVRVEPELSVEERDLLRGALGGARATEQVEIQRLGSRLVTGYGQRAGASQDDG
jgi:hypothetical protein